MVGDRAKLVDALNKVTDRNEKLLAEEQKLKENYEGKHSTQNELVVALDKQNGLLRQMVEEKEDEITELERKITAMEAAGSGTHLFLLCLLISILWPYLDVNFCRILYIFISSVQLLSICSL